MLAIKPIMPALTKARRKDDKRVATPVLDANLETKGVASVAPLGLTVVTSDASRGATRGGLFDSLVAIVWEEMGTKASTVAGKARTHRLVTAQKIRNETITTILCWAQELHRTELFRNRIVSLKAIFQAVKSGVAACSLLTSP